MVLKPLHEYLRTRYVFLRETRFEGKTTIRNGIPVRVLYGSAVGLSHRLSDRERTLSRKAQSIPYRKALL